MEYGLLLAGGLGTRMGKCTEVTNKHLLPIYNRPMIDYSLKTLQMLGVKYLLIITGDKSAFEIMRYVRNGNDHGFENVYYVTQIGNGGIADAIRLGKNFTHDKQFCVVLADNVLSLNFEIDKDKLKEFLNDEKRALVGFKKIKDNKRFGVPTFDKETGKLVKITEKPTQPDSEYAQIGIYCYHKNAYDFIDKLKKSERGELEVTDLNNMYLNQQLLSYFTLGENIFWSDAGNNDTLLYCSNYVNEHQHFF